MKNKFILTSALALALMLTGCGGGSTNETAPAADNAVDTVADTVADTAAGLSESAAADTEETTEETTKEATEETTEAAGEEDDDISRETGKYYDGVFHGNGYTLKIDSDVWMDISVMIDYARKAANNSDIDFGIDFTDEQYSDVYDGMFICPDSNGANFNITVVDIGMDMNIADEDIAELYSALIEQQYAALEGCTFYGCQTDSAGGYDCLKAEVEMTNKGVTMRMAQYCFWENKKQIAITFTATPDEYDEMLPEFEKVLNTVSFKG